MVREQRQGWLFGPAPDLLLGCGLFYLPLTLLFWAAGPTLQQAAPAWLGPLLVLAFGMPHYGATLLRVYRDPAERRAYRFFTVYTTLFMVVALAFAVRSPWFAALMVTVYITWSPWHYTGQNYGIAVMFLRRNGVELTPLPKGWLYASFILSYALVFLGMHMDRPTRGEVLGYETHEIAPVPLGIPDVVDAVLFPLLLAALVGATAVCIVLLLRRAPLRALAPALTLLLTQSLWFSVPRIAFHTPWSPPFLDLTQTAYTTFYALWIAFGHYVQYLWITSYYARADRRWKGYTSYFASTFLFGSAIFTIPMVVFAPDAFGTFDYTMGLYLTVTAAVNIHHFILDGAIWKLRNSRIASVLIRSSEAGPELDTSGSDPRWLSGFAKGLATVGAALAIIGFAEVDVVLPEAIGRGEYERAVAVLDRAAWYGRDEGRLRTAVGNELIRAGDVGTASEQFWRGLALRPHAPSFVELGRLYESYGRHEEAVRIWERGLASFPDDPDLLRKVEQARQRSGTP